jgi:hypothetical protein
MPISFVHDPVAVEAARAVRKLVADVIVPAGRRTRALLHDAPAALGQELPAAAPDGGNMRSIGFSVTHRNTSRKGIGGARR